MAIQVESILNLPAYAIYGLQISNNSSTPNTQVDISAGACRDSNNNVDMVIGTNFPNAEGQTFSAPLTIDATVVGVNGIDAGALGNNLLYAVYIIGDSHGYKVPAGLLSLASNSSPTMPFDYDSYRLIGYLSTNSSAHFIPGQLFGKGNDREWHYDGGQSLISGGAATSPTNVALTARVPAQENAIALMAYDFIANAAGDVFTLRSFSASNPYMTGESQAAGATAHLQANTEVPVSLNSGAPTIKYAVSAGTINLDVVGYKFSV